MELPKLSEVLAARNFLGECYRTPLVPLRGASGPLLKMENLQPFGSYKIRGVSFALEEGARAGRLGAGVVTASAGNMAQSVAYLAGQRGISCTVLLPESAPEVKRRKVEELGARTKRLPFAEVWDVVRRGESSEPGYLIHPTLTRSLLAGYGTLALEILEDCPEVETVLVPFGVGGLTLALANTFRLLGKRVRVVACEIETAAPLRASFAQGAAARVDKGPSFVDAIGTPEVLPAVFENARQLVAFSEVVTEDETKAAVRALYHRHRVVAEGAGAVPVAAALRAYAERPGVVCVVSGGNLNPETLHEIIR